MSVQRPPSPQQFQFGGLNLSGNPIKRPAGSAYFAENVRVMDGGWLRLKGGRIARRNLTNAVMVRRITDVHVRAFDLSDDYHLMLIEYASSVFKMCRLNLADFTVDEAGIETISAASPSDSRYCLTTLNNSVIFSNGHGYVNTFPALTQWAPPSTVRYFGLQEPVVDTIGITFTPGVGENTVSRVVRLFVGVYNESTNHYSNGVEIGEVTSTGATGTITVDISYVAYQTVPTHGASETAEQRYVFYATIDGLNVPYLILNAALDGPHTVPMKASPDTSLITANLSISAGTTNGWVLDTTKEMPIRNNPPLMMRSIAFAGGRIYGIYSDTVGFGTDSQLDRSAAVWSEADGSQRYADFLGDPLQSWPLDNVSPTPSGERPLACLAAPNSVEVLYFTAQRTFLLREQSDGLQEWDTISSEHGIFPTMRTHPEALICKTRHGIVWLTQNRQLAIYRTTGEFNIISADYDGMFGPLDEMVCMSYWYDPQNFVDRVELYYQRLNAGGGYTPMSLCHDFATGATTTKGPGCVYAAQTISSRLGPQRYHVTAAAPYANTVPNVASSPACGIYTIEGQPDNGGLVPLKDGLFTGTSGQTATTADVEDGWWIPNWQDFGDPNLRKQISQVDMIGDGELSAALNDYAITLGHFQGYTPVVVNGLPFTTTQINPVKVAQIVEDGYYRFKIATPHKTVWKFVLRLRGHSADMPTVYWPKPSNEGDEDTNFYGAVLGLLWTVAPNENRL